VADITYESFFERAMHGTASSRLTPETSLVIRRPLFGCQCCGATLAVAFLNTNLLQKSIHWQKKLNILISIYFNHILPFHLDFVHCVATSKASEYHLLLEPTCQHQNLYIEDEQPG
jgi:hypothetical protein